MDENARKLVHDFLHGQIDDHGMVEFDRLLREDPSVSRLLVKEATMCEQLRRVYFERDNVAVDEKAPDAGDTATNFMSLLGELDARGDSATIVDLSDEVKQRKSMERRQRSLARMTQPAKGPTTRHYVIPRPLFYGSIAAAVAIAALLFWPDQTSDSPSPRPEETSFFDVAVVVEQVDAVWDVGERKVNAGDSIRNEPITLSEGIAKLRFHSGAEVILEAPCTFEPVSPLAMRVQHGDLWARCELPSSKGFMVESTNARIVDLGTEFGISVSDDGVLDAHVFDGEVEISAVTADGVQPSSVLIAGQARRVSSDGQNITTLDANPYRFVRGMTADDRDRVAGYVNAVKSLKPAAYYRFESIVDDDALENEMGVKYRARLIDDVRLEETGAGRAGRFGGGYVQLLRTITELSDQPRYSMECWVKPNELKLGAVLTMAAYAENPIEMPILGGLVLQNPIETIKPERSGRVRFIHRNPPRTSFGTEVLQPQLYEAGRWMHIVAVKTESKLNLYVNGRLTAAVNDATTWAEDEFATRIGINVPSADIGHRRPFKGLIDEVAIYDRALSEDQIREHYERLIVLLED